MSVGPLVRPPVSPSVRPSICSSVIHKLKPCKSAVFDQNYYQYERERILFRVSGLVFSSQTFAFSCNVAKSFTKVHFPYAKYYLAYWLVIHPIFHGFCCHAFPSFVSIFHISAWKDKSKGNSRGCCSQTDWKKTQKRIFFFTFYLSKIVA